jgi:catechol 2,3-dioxygenase-like lactoylglutathione lyase family enzyme
MQTAHSTNVPPAPSLAFSHIGLFVHDLPAMEHFYAKLLGFTVTDRGNLGERRLVFLSRDVREHHQIVLVTGRPADLAFNVVNQISFRVDSIASLRHFHDVMKAAGVQGLDPVTHGNAISLYLRDPEGNRIEMFLDTPWYCAQPCREPVDLAQSDAEILAGTEALARSLPNFKSRESWMAELRQRIEAGQPS